MKRHTSAYQARSRSRRKGQALVEMAVAVLLLLSILIGIMEFGFLARNNLLLANASREGARAAAVGRSTSAIQTRVTNTMKPLTTTFGTSTTNSRLEYSSDNGATWTAWPADSGLYNGVPVGSLIRVIATTRHKQLTGFFKILKDRDIAQTTSMKREANG